MMPLETDLDRIAALARQRADEFAVLRYTVELLEEDLPDGELDALVDELAAPVVDAIDCTTCANCCRSIDVYLTPADVERLAEGLLIPVEAVFDRYVDHQVATLEGEWGMFKDSPCALLDGKRCGVYPHRPESCRAYPQFTPEFRWVMGYIIEGAGICPIVYNVLDALARELAARGW